MEWRSNQVISVFGKKRSGKSQFAKTVLWPNISSIVLWDVKWEHVDLEAPVAHNLEAIQTLWDTGYEKIIYRPWNASADDFDELCHMIFMRGNTCLWCDELASISTPLSYPHYLGECIRLGQIRGIGVILLSQRPALIPSIAISEADIIVSFRLQLFKDAEKICAVMGEQFIGDLMHQPDYYFVIYDFKEVQHCAPLQLTGAQLTPDGKLVSEIKEGEENA